MKKVILGFIAIVAIAYDTSAQMCGYFTAFENFGAALPNKILVRAWRNETVILPFLIKARYPEKLTFQLTTGGKDVGAELIQLHLVEGDISAGSCGNAKKNGTFEKQLFPDRAETLTGSSFEMDSTTSYGLVKLQIPEKLKAGKYPVELTFDQNDNSVKLEAVVQVINRKLPPFATLDYDIDFWQFPLSISSYYKLNPYSEEHWVKIAEMFEQLKGINQTVVTTSVFYDIYNSVIKPLDEMMIQVRKKSDGTYTYDYSTFEKYVELAASKGVSKEIAVHNLFPWNLTYFYFDEASDAVKTFKAETGTPAYDDFWKPFLVDFASFLKKKGWIDKTVFWVDERDANTTALLIKYVKSINPAFKFGFSGRFSPGLSEMVHDYSLASNIVLDEEKMASRKDKGYKTTFYTSCFEAQPNMVLGSNYNDIYFLVMLSRARGYDGMLRWAFNRWSPQIMTSAVYSDVPSGDAHFVYPDGQLSLRYLILKDALEEVQKADVKSNSATTTELLNSYTRYPLLKAGNDRMNLVNIMKNYLND